MTPAGEHFLYHVDRILRELDAATEEILEIGQKEYTGTEHEAFFSAFLWQLCRADDPSRISGTLS
jgi:DNA-binding transcriptional LysR family regulator